jgi:hypothetical protein
MSSKMVSDLLAFARQNLENKPRASKKFTYATVLSMPRPNGNINGSQQSSRSAIEKKASGCGT